MSSMNHENHFSAQNIPYGIASSTLHPNPQPVTRVKNTVIFLSDLAFSGVFVGITDLNLDVFMQPTLNNFAALPKYVHQHVRCAIQRIYQDNDISGFPKSSLEDVDQIKMYLPVEIRDFTDTSCSLFHVRNAGRIIGKSDRIPLNFSHGPLAYQGRTASIVPSGTPIKRPCGHFPDPEWSGQSGSQGQHPIVHGPSRKMDYEVELAAVIGKPHGMHQSLTPELAEEHVFGYILMNDWSARDIQGFEMLPLGPFNGKSLGTSISPWIVTTDALQPFRIPARQQDLPTSAPLYTPNLTTYTINIDVSVIREGQSTTTGNCSLTSLYWTPDQMIAHTTQSGSALRTGDLIATGTVSGDKEGSYGCLLEATEGGSVPVTLVDGSRRSFLEDGDVVSMVGYAGTPDSGVGFGQCVGELVGI